MINNSAKLLTQENTMPLMKIATLFKDVLIGHGQGTMGRVGTGVKLVIMGTECHEGRELSQELSAVGRKSSALLGGDMPNVTSRHEDFLG